MAAQPVDGGASYKLQELMLPGLHNARSREEQ